MRRRAWWLVAANVLFPGAAQVAAGGRRLGRIGVVATLVLWMLALAAVALLVLWPQAAYVVGANPITLTLVQVLLLAYAVLWLVLTFDTLRLVRLIKLRPGARITVPALAVAVMLLFSGGAVYASQTVGVARDALGSIFGLGGPVVEPSDGYYNILLLGADSGEGRDSMRPDSISVVSINAETGAATITGIPRDMVNVPFAEGPMQDLFPDGYGGPECSTAHCAMNEIFTEVNVLRDGAALYPGAEATGSDPGIEAVKDAAAGLLGIDIPYYVFIDMNGFAALVDALGGVEITVDERLPEGGGPAYPGQPAEEWATGWIEPGTQVMDGDTAQWYARSRYTTSDWDRMKRQRELQEAILRQFTPANVVTRFQDVLEAGGNLIETDIPESMVPYFIDLGMQTKELPLSTIELTPEGGVDPEDPDIEYIRELVQQSLHPPSPTPSP
ncbi:LCP family protein [Microbacterium sp. LRZ72]|nr:LCP family protein [Microbacterium sp. LRZ72]MDX2377007.1 LCP family protein [Microbacterium sp. LRZ72]